MKIYFALICLGLICGFCFGVCYGSGISGVPITVVEKDGESSVQFTNFDNHGQPDIEIVEVIREVEVVKEVEVPVEVEIIKEVPVTLRQFENVQELKGWLHQVPEQIVLVANSEGVIKLTGACEDVAVYLQDKAIEDGFKMSIEVLSRDEYHKWYGEWLGQGRLHAINNTIIDNEFWFIDFPSNKVWLGAYLDD